MKVGFIGAGRMATTIGRHLIGAGHEVVLSSSRGPEALAGLVADLGPAASAGSKQEAAECDVVFLATIGPIARRRSRESTGAAAYSSTGRTPTWARNRTSALPA